MSMRADEEPWMELDEIFDEKWLLRADIDAAMAQVVARQVAMGAHESDARNRVDANDRVNAQEVHSKCRRPDLVVDISVSATRQQQV
jgi:pantothenate kinase